MGVKGVEKSQRELEGINGSKGELKRVSESQRELMGVKEVEKSQRELEGINGSKGNWKELARVRGS